MLPGAPERRTPRLRKGGINSVTNEEGAETVDTETSLFDVNTPLNEIANTWKSVLEQLFHGNNLPSLLKRFGKYLDKTMAQIYGTA